MALEIDPDLAEARSVISSTKANYDFDLQAAVTPELIGGLVVLGLIALIPAVARGYCAIRRGAKARPGTPTLPSPAGGGG